MFKCRNCGCEFEDPKLVPENRGEGMWEDFYYCPNCGDYDYAEERRCDVCGEKHFNDGDYCDNCLEDAKDFLRTDFGHFPHGRIMDLIDLFNIALDDIYVEEKKKEGSTK